MLKPSLQLKLGQTLTMTPQLQQAIRLLQLPVLDLNAQIQDALEENIMLEMEDLPDVPKVRASSPPPRSRCHQGRGQLADTFERGAHPATAAGTVKAGRSMILPTSRARRLQRASAMAAGDGALYSARGPLIGEAIVDYINDDGYLTDRISTKSMHQHRRRGIAGR